LEPRKECLLFLWSIIDNNDKHGGSEIEHATECGYLVETTSLPSEAFEADNGKVWSVLNNLILTGTINAFIWIL
jgi:hypothetical protein